MPESAPAFTQEPAARLAARFGSSVVDDAAARTSLRIGGVVPALVARPESVADLAAMVAEVAAVGGALVPLGRGVHRGLGHAPRRYDLALVTDRLTHVRDYTPADMTVTVEAGATVADLQQVLAAEGQWLPLEPPAPSATTIGGLLAADLGGPLVTSQGRVRDFVIGLAVVTAEGVPAKAGGRVVKNVAGYDLMKLFIGSLGTLGVVTEATFKVRPRPKVQRTLVFTAGTLAEARAFAAGLETTRTAILAATVLVELGRGAAGPTAVVVRTGGAPADVAAVRTRLLTHAAACRVALAHEGDAAALAHEDRVRDGVRAAAGDLVVRLVALPASAGILLAEVIAAMPEVAGTAHFDPGRGATTLAIVTDSPSRVLDTLAAAAAPHGAHLVVERWPVELAPTIEVWRPLPSALPLMRRVKAALDPRGTFAPGRFVGRL